MSYHVNDIDEKILDAIYQIFFVNLQQQPGLSNDPLALQVLRQAPLQDDPTLTAPYVVYNNDIDPKGQSIRLLTRGEEEEEYGAPEIGGPLRYLYGYGCQFGTPERQTREQARADGAALMSRITSTLIHYADLSDVLSPGMLTSDDGTKWIEGQNFRLVRGAGYSIFGGDTTFYGKGRAFWVYPVAWSAPIHFP